MHRCPGLTDEDALGTDCRLVGRDAGQNAGHQPALWGGKLQPDLEVEFSRTNLVLPLDVQRVRGIGSRLLLRFLSRLRLAKLDVSRQALSLGSRPDHGRSRRDLPSLSISCI